MTTLALEVTLDVQARNNDCGKGGQGSGQTNNQQQNSKALAT